MSLLKDAGHLLRFFVLFVIAFLVFWAIRGYVVPKTFGKYGHYRAAAIDEIAARPAHYAGHDTCETCHSDIAGTKSAGKHVTVNCEACHGPLAKHAEDPTIDPGKPDTAKLCVRCHAQSAARPKNFPQVKAEEHSNGMPCETCHQPHSPGMNAPADSKGGAK